MHIVTLTLGLLLLFSIGFVDVEAKAFDLTMNFDDEVYTFPFVEVMDYYKNIRQQPSITILDDELFSNHLNSSKTLSYHLYRVESDDNLFNMATHIHDSQTNSSMIIATVQITNGSSFDIFSTLSVVEHRQKRSSKKDYIVKQNSRIIDQASVTIDWLTNRRRQYDNSNESIEYGEDARTVDPPFYDESISSIEVTTLTVNTIDNVTDEVMNSTTMATTEKLIPEKKEHIYLEIVAVIDSLILNDVRTILDRTETESIEILKYYYLHVFMGVQHMYRQSLVYETMDVHIRLSKMIFATSKNQLPWESFKNISSTIDRYRKSPNNMTLRPNVSMNLLKSLHQAYKGADWDSKYSIGHADHIMTFTRLDLIDGAGSAYVLGTCLPLFKYSIIQEDLNSFSTTLTAAHELGHNLGLNHDEIENNCNDPRVRYIMSPKNMNTVDRRQLTIFSPCSIEQLKSFAHHSSTTCWKNQIISSQNDPKFEKLREIISTKLGQIIDIHQQCQLQYGPQAKPYISVTYDSNQTLYEETVCDQLRCFKRIEDEFMYWQEGALEGK